MPIPNFHSNTSLIWWTKSNNRKWPGNACMTWGLRLVVVPVNCATWYHMWNSLWRTTLHIVYACKHVVYALFTCCLRVLYACKRVVCACKHVVYACQHSDIAYIELKKPTRSSAQIENHCRVAVTIDFVSWPPLCVHASCHSTSGFWREREAIKNPVGFHYHHHSRNPQRSKTGFVPFINSHLLQSCTW